MAHTFKNNTHPATASDNTSKKRMLTNYNFVKSAVSNSCAGNSNFIVRDVTQNSKNVKKVSYFKDYSYLLDLNMAKSLPFCTHSYDISLCDSSFNVDTANELNDILNTMIFDGSAQTFVKNYALVPGDSEGAGDISGINYIDNADIQFNQYFLDPSGTLFNNNCQSDNKYLGLLDSNIIKFDPSLNPLPNPINPVNNKYYKNRINTGNIHNGVYFDG